MQIQITRGFAERALSPIAFQQNEYVTMPDALAERLIAEGKARVIPTFDGPTPKSAKKKR